MSKILMSLLLSLPLFADLFPATTQSTILNTNNNIIQISPAFPANGMSGVIIHTYKDGSSAATTAAVQNESGVLTIIDAPLMENGNLPQIATKVIAGDKVIGGYLYNNVLLLAPNQNTYNEITSKYKKNWVSPDNYASFISQKRDGIPTKENLTSFAKSYQVGLIAIVKKDSIVVYDPISQRIISREPVSMQAQTQTPFFSNFEKVRTGWFGGVVDEDYYTLMEQIN
ncbi:MAG: plasminogen-binding N-terminal domain-containing protein [Sulfurovaceae bacterium]|nr:plasminogen-binding N-terminal domain-containing protein [Sulfurovaceae bacterium]MDD5548599.1 plasminogen-binding N-terminal domain-containing protein [Sulfurovaceae bacterium]